MGPPPGGAAVFRRLRTIAGHLQSEVEVQRPLVEAEQACADYSTLRSSTRKDDVFCIRPGVGAERRQYVRCCSTTHAEVREVFGNLGLLNTTHCTPSPNEAPAAPPARSSQLSVHAELEDDFLPASLLYPDSWPVSATERNDLHNAKFNGNKHNEPGPLFARQAAETRRIGLQEVSNHGKLPLREPLESTKVRVQPLRQGSEWVPRMDICESPRSYAVSLELPGVAAEGIRVELTDGSLVITGTRPAEVWTNVGGITFSPNAGEGGAAEGVVYHRRELAQGPYRATWKLPKHSDLDSVTAEFCDGVLVVVIPKKN